MKEREELELILKLIRKYNLPLSPILEYAVNEKMEEFPDRVETIYEEITDIENASLPRNNETKIIEEDKRESCSNNPKIQTESHSIEVIEPKIAPVNDDDYYYSDLEIEHVYLDSRGKIIEEKTTHEVLPEINSNTGNRKGKPWTENEEELITLYFRQGKDTSTIAEIIGRTEVAIKARLAKLGLIDYTYGQEDSTLAESTKESDFSIENSFVRCFILNKRGERVFSAEGKMKYLNGKLYRLNLKNECFTVKSMAFNGEIWMKGPKKIVAYPKSDLYRIIDNVSDYYDKIEDIDDCSSFKDCKLKVNGLWYSYDGSPIEDEKKSQVEIKDEERTNINDSHFSVKIGDVLRLFPSQLVGSVVKLRIDKTGRKKIVVKSDDGPIVEVYDSKFLYEKLNSKEKTIVTPKKSLSNYNKDVILSPKNNTKAKVGDSIQWKPTGEVGRVVGFKQVGSLKKIVLRIKEGQEIEVYDNPKAYSIVIEDIKSDELEKVDRKTSPKVIRVGDRIKVRIFNEICKVVKIEGQGMPFEMLTIQFKDGHQDWIINNPDLYAIVE